MLNQDIYIAVDDFSTDHSLAKYGISLAKHLRANAVLIGIERPHYTEVAPAIAGTGILPPVKFNLAEQKSRTFAKLKTIQSRLLKTWPHIDCEVIIGFPEAKLIQKVAMKQPELVLLEGKSNFNTLNEWFGTYETRIIDGVNRPTLVLPKDYKWKPVHKILYFMNSDDIRVENVRHLVAAATNLKASVQVVVLTDHNRVSEQQHFERISQVFNKFLGFQEIEFQQVVDVKRVRELKNIVNIADPEWLVVEHKSNNFLEQFFSDFNTQSLILQAERPLLVF